MSFRSPAPLVLYCLAVALCLSVSCVVRVLGSPPPSAAYLQHIAPPCASVNATHLPCISGNNCSGRQASEACVLTVSLPAPDREVLQETGVPPKPSAIERWGLGCLSVGVVSLSGVFGAFLWPIMNTPLYQHVLRALIGLAVGSLTSTALFQLIPEGFCLKERDSDQSYLSTALFSWVSLWLIFLIEAFAKIAFNKNHDKKIEIKMVNGVKTTPQIKDVERNNLLPTEKDKGCEKPSDLRVAPVAWMIIFGDGLHNFIDGMSIGAGYSHSVATGLGLSLAIACEEFPHELGDFAILVQSGMSVRRALAYNFLSACTAFVGLALGIVLGQLEGSHYIFAFAGGLFLYISLTHLVPELQSVLKQELRKGRTEAFVAFLLQNVGILLGATVIYLITKYNDDITTGF